MANRGNTHKKWRSRLVRAQNGRCYYCSRKFDEDDSWLHSTVDHMQPLCLGGKNTVMNYVAACKRCNVLKGNEGYKSFMAFWKNAWHMMPDDPREMISQMMKENRE